MFPPNLIPCGPFGNLPFLLPVLFGPFLPSQNFNIAFPLRTLSTPHTTGSSVPSAAFPRGTRGPGDHAGVPPAVLHRLLPAPLRPPEPTTGPGAGGGRRRRQWAGVVPTRTRQGGGVGPQHPPAPPPPPFSSQNPTSPYFLSGTKAPPPPCFGPPFGGLPGDPGAKRARDGRFGSDPMRPNAPPVPCVAPHRRRSSPAPRRS